MLLIVVVIDRTDKTAQFCHGGRSPATAAVKAEGKWTPFSRRILQTSCTLFRRARGSQQCCTSADVSNSRRRKAALVNSPHRMLWKQGSTSRASQAAVSFPAREKRNDLIVASEVVYCCSSQSWMTWSNETQAFKRTGLCATWQELFAYCNAV